MEGEMKRKFLAVIEELEIDNEGYVIIPAITEEEPSAVTEEPVIVETEPVAVEAELPVVEAPAEEVAVAIDNIGEVPAPKYVNKNFAQKMMLADEVIQDRYDEVKNYALRFKKLKARISKKFESINQGRLQFVKISVAGKTLKLYLNMDISEVDPKFRCKDMRGKVTYATVPVMLRIKSGRAVRYAKILIDQCAAKYGLVENKKFQEVDAMKVVEDFLAEREAKKLAKLGGDDDADNDVMEEVTDTAATEEVADTATEEVADTAVTEEAVEDTATEEVAVTEDIE